MMGAVGRGRWMTWHGGEGKGGMGGGNEMAGDGIEEGRGGGFGFWFLRGGWVERMARGAPGGFVCA